MGDDCCSSKGKNQALIKAPDAAKEFGKKRKSGCNDANCECHIASPTIRAREIIAELEAAIHLETRPGIGHIHAILGEKEKARAIQLRAEFLGLLPEIPEQDKQTHIKSALETACGSVASFLSTGKLPDSKFDSFYHALIELNSHFHEDGPDHIHRTPHESELDKLRSLRAKCMELLPNLREDARMRPTLEICCKPTLDFLQTGNL